MDPEDPTVIAETELMGAAASIEAAAKKLEQLKPRAKPKVSRHADLTALKEESSSVTTVLVPIRGGKIEGRGGGGDAYHAVLTPWA